MAARKTTKTRKKPQYVRASKRKGAEPPKVARRAITVGLMLLVLGGLVLGVKAGLGWMGRQLKSENPRFEMQHLVISSDGNLTEDRIREYTDLREGVNLWSFTFDEIEESLSTVPKIESVYLERKLPNTLIIKVKERVAVARIMGQTERRYPFVADRYGFILPPKRSAESLPLIKGLDAELRLGEQVTHADVETSLRIINLCESTGHLRDYVRIESLDVKYSDFIDMRLQDGIRVRMPRFSLNLKLQNLASVIKIANGQGRRVKEVNLTLDSAKVPVTYY